MLKVLKKKMYIPFNLEINNMNKIFNYENTYLKDQNSKKINLSYQEYRKNGESYIFPSVKKAMDSYKTKCNQRFGYLPLNGDENFIRKSTEIMLGIDSNQINGVFDYNKIAINQSIGSTGGFLLGLYLLKFLYKTTENNSIFIPNVSGKEKIRVIRSLNFNPQYYEYFDHNQKKLVFEDFFNSLKKLEKGSVVLLEPINQDPTGLSLEKKEWEEIADLAVKKNFLIFMNLRNLGLESGDFSQDAEVCRIFASKKVQLMVSQGLSASFSLYGHRLGSLLIFNQPEKNIDSLKKFMAHLTRNTYNFYPRYSSDIANIVYDSPELFKELQENLKDCVEDVRNRKELLIKSLSSEDNFDELFLEKQKGLFLYTGLNETQISNLRNNHGVHIFNNSKLSLSGINEKNVDYISKALNDVFRNKE